MATVVTKRVTAAAAGGSTARVSSQATGGITSRFTPNFLLAEGDAQTNGDRILLEGDMQSGDDLLKLEGDQVPIVSSTTTGRVTL